MQAIKSNDQQVRAPFIRNRMTWLAYGLMAFFGFQISILGPLMPFIAEKMALTYTEIGYHFLLSSLGGLITSLIGDRIATRLGYNRMIMFGATLICLGYAGVIFGTSLPATLFCVWLAGFGGGSVIMTVTATLAIANPKNSSIAFTEANIGAGLAMILGPMLVGIIAASTLGWQAMVITLPLFILSVGLLFRGASLPTIEKRKQKVDQSPLDTEIRLPMLFWVYGILMLLTVALEFLIFSWTANFLAVVVGYSASEAAGLVSIFAVALVIGRLFGRRLLQMIPESRLVVLSLLWILVTFPIFWLGTGGFINIVGLFLVGLGISNVSPVVQARAMDVSGDARDRASARIILFPSLGNLVMLQLMGILADNVGIQRAFAMFIVLLVVAIALTIYAERLRVASAN